MYMKLIMGHQPQATDLHVLRYMDFRKAKCFKCLLIEQKGLLPETFLLSLHVIHYQVGNNYWPHECYLCIKLY